MERRGLLVSRLILVSVAALMIGLIATFNRPARANTLVVTSTLDSGAGSLRAAVANAKTGDEIRFNKVVFSEPVTIVLTSGPITFSKSITLNASALPRPVVDGNHRSRVFSINSGVTIRLVGIGIANGLCAACEGGGIRNSGILLIEDSVLTGNRAIWQNGKVSGNGGAIHNLGVLTVTSSVFVSNSVTGIGEGAAIANIRPGKVDIVNSTFVSNTSAAYGGAVSSRGNTTTFIRNSLLAYNTSGVGGALYAYQGIVTLRNTILANNAGGNCVSQAATLLDAGGNLRWPTTDSSCASSIGYGDPLLDTLKDNGGPVPTLALLPGSAAIDNGDDATCAATDPRGISRPQGLGCDSGPFESRGFQFADIAGTDQTASPDTAFAVPLSLRVTSLFSEPVQGGRVSFSAPISGPSLTIAPSVVISVQGDVAALNAKANGITGTYTVTASARGVRDAAVFRLRNLWVTRMELVASASTLHVGDPLTLTANFDWDAPFTPTHVITLLLADGNIVRPMIGHTVTYVTDALPVGTHVITAAYDGSPSIAASSDVVTVTVVYYSVYTVTNPADTGRGTLREGLRYVSPGGPIFFRLADHEAISLASELVVDRDVMIEGPGMDTLAVSGNNITRVFSVAPDAHVSIRGLSVVNGRCDGCAGGAIHNAGDVSLAEVRLSGSQVTGDGSSGNGGAIANFGRMTVTGSLIDHNRTGLITRSITSASRADLRSCARGGGILNAGVMWVADTTLLDNEAGCGGALANTGALDLTNVTIAGNVAGLAGGAVDSDGALDALNSTIVSNSAPLGGVTGAGAVTLRNTLLARNLPGGNCLNSVIDGGHNLEDADGCGFGTDNGSLTNTNPLLAPLDRYDSALQTLALLPGSKAIDAADDANCPDTDSRGVQRMGVCDIGAFESRGFNLVAESALEQRFDIGSSFAVPLLASIASDYAEPVDGGQVTFNAPANGASAILSPTIAEVAHGAAGSDARPNQSAGIYAVTVSARGVQAPVVYRLTNASATSISLQISSAEITYGEPITLEVSVTSGHGVPGGRVIFQDADTPIRVVTLDETGRAMIVTDSLAVGGHTLTALYEGDGVFDPGASPTMTLTVARASVSVNLDSSPNPTDAGEPIVFTATVRTPSIGVEALTGTVTFYEVAGGSRSAALTGVDLVSGTAVHTMTLSPGAHSIVAAYSGDTNCDVGMSLALEQVVTVPSPALVSLSPLTITQGAAGVTLELTGTGFVPGSVVNWNGANRNTGYAHDGLLFASIPATDLAVSGEVSVTVLNPGPGGGWSNEIPFTVISLPHRRYFVVIQR